MEQTANEASEHREYTKKDLFPQWRLALIFVLAIGLGIAAHFGIISSTTAILSLLAYLGYMLFCILEGLYYQVTFARYELALARDERASASEVLFEKVISIEEKKASH